MSYSRHYIIIIKINKKNFPSFLSFGSNELLPSYGISRTCTWTLDTLPFICTTSNIIILRMASTHPKYHLFQKVHVFKMLTLWFINSTFNPRHLQINTCIGLSWLKKQMAYMYIAIGLLWGNNIRRIYWWIPVLYAFWVQETTTVVDLLVKVGKLDLFTL